MSEHATGGGTHGGINTNDIVEIPFHSLATSMLVMSDHKRVEPQPPQGEIRCVSSFKKRANITFVLVFVPVVEPGTMRLG